MERNNQIDIGRIARVYFVGIGGIGMSALARYFCHFGKAVAGYDRMATPLTEALAREGCAVHYEDLGGEIPVEFRAPSPETLVVYTPAVPRDLGEMQFLRNAGHRLYKRAEVLGAISKGYHTIAVAGTHGKTTTSTLIAHLLARTVGCDALLGGIAHNFTGNLVLADKGKRYFVAEADEYDRSFLQLYPDVTVITSLAADHLDIYGTMDGLLAAFREFAGHTVTHRLVLHQRVADYFAQMGFSSFQYGLNERCDYWASDIFQRGSRACFTLHRPEGECLEVELGVPGQHNVENALAAIAAIESVGVMAEDVLPLLASFRGVERRFDVRYASDHLVYIDDYAHHPDELRATINAARSVYPGKRITGLFQPHLYTRTRDLAHDFAHALSALDTLLLLPIYPAREAPIAGVDSQMLLSLLPHSMQKMLVDPKDLPRILKAIPFELLLSMGAGSIGTLAPEIEKVVREKDGINAD